MEPGLFKKVTGLPVNCSELLVSLGAFNSALTNDAVYRFKRYGDASLEYTGINKHRGEEVGLYDTVLAPQEFRAAFENLDRNRQPLDHLARIRLFAVASA